MTMVLSAKSFQDITNVDVYKSSGALKDQRFVANPGGWQGKKTRTYSHAPTF